MHVTPGHRNTRSTGEGKLRGKCWPCRPRWAAQTLSMGVIALSAVLVAMSRAPWITCNAVGVRRCCTVPPCTTRRPPRSSACTAVPATVCSGRCMQPAHLHFVHCQRRHLLALWPLRVDVHQRLELLPPAAVLSHRVPASLARKQPTDRHRYTPGLAVCTHPAGSSYVPPVALVTPLCVGIEPIHALAWMSAGPCLKSEDSSPSIQSSNFEIGQVTGEVTIINMRTGMAKYAPAGETTPLLRHVGSVCKQ